MPFDSGRPSAAMNDLVVREKRSRRTAVPAPRFAAAAWSDFKAQRCLEVSSIHRNAGLRFLRVTNEHKRQTHQRKYESRHRQMIVAFKSAALGLFSPEMSSKREDLWKANR